MEYETVKVDQNLKLERLQPNQADELFKLTEINREYVGEFLSWVPHVRTVEDSRKHIIESIDKSKRGSAYTYGIFIDDEVIGNISLSKLNDDALTPEIGYWISNDYSGRGLMTLCVKSLTRVGLNSLGLKKIAIRAEPKNIASNKVAEKSGYTLTGSETKDDKLFNVWSITE